MNTIIIDGNNCKSKQDLFDTFKAVLRFPDYFTYNWDSFEEVINDMKLPKHTMILLTFYRALLKENKEDKLIFLEIIRAANIENDYKFYKILPID
jgi:RNAse (barnase) inhibitor barstar